MKRIQSIPILSITLQIIAVLALWAIMVYTVGNVVSRLAGFGPIPAAIELVTRWWMVPLVFAGWALAHLGKEHIRVEFISENSTRTIRTALYWVNTTLLLLFLALLTVGSFLGAQQNRMRGEYGIDTGAPVWTTRYVIPILAVAFILLIAADVWKKLASRSVPIASDPSEAAATQRKVSHDNN